MIEIPSNELVIVWLDPYIGVPGNCIHLKEVFTTTTDPTHPCPINLCDRNSIEFYSHTTDSIYQHRFPGPCQLKCFTDEEECLNCVDECLNAYKQIFLILPDNVGEEFFLRIYKQHEKEFQKTQNEISIKFYIFIYMDKIEEWLYEYEEYLRIYYHEADLLYALTRDIAIYYMTVGEKLFTQNTLNDLRQALIYFHWAKKLFFRGNSMSSYKETELQTYSETMINESELIIHSLTNEDHLSCDSRNKLIENIFIYCPIELNGEAFKLKALFNQILNKRPLLFNSANEFISNFQLENYKNQHNCPIVIFSNIQNQTNIFEELSSIKSVEHIYPLDSSKDKLTEQRNHGPVLRRFPKIRNISSSTTALVLEWILDHATECEKIAEYFKDNGDSKRARMYYEKSIKLNECLCTLIKNQ